MPKRIVALTDKKIDDARPKETRYAIYDPSAPGLAIRVQPSGHKTFVLGARFPRTGQFTRVELGQVGKLTLDEARAKARRWGEWISRGVDPRDEEERLRKATETTAALAAGNTFMAVAEDFIARHLKGKRKARVATREIRTELVRHWGPRPITEISRRDVVELIEKIADRPAPAYARNILDHIRVLFNWAINRGIYGLEASPCDRLKPAQLIGVKKSRERVLSDAELQALWAASETLSYPCGPIVRLLALTGARRNEVTGARWSEFDLDARLWTVPAERFKMGVTHMVPLTDDMMALLKALPRWKDSDLLFTTAGKKAATVTSAAKQRIDAFMRAELGKLDPFILHDVRRTVRTRLSALRIPEPVAEMVIGHKRKGIVGVYDLHKFIDEMREALEAWNARLRSIISPPPANVVAFAGAER